ncbi:MAG: Sapep family Mn(2+)-dependent dipeptidase, partial [Angelakisella sp.]
DAAIAMAEKKGFTAKNHNYHYGTVEHFSGDKTIGIFSHLDVVPEGTGWTGKPYEPVEKDGYLIGRGVADDKGAAVAGMHVMRCLESLGVPFNSKISLFMGCCEETGMTDIVRYVEEQPMPDFSIIPDTNFPVCHGEKGILEVDACAGDTFTQITSFSGGLASNMVPDTAVARLPYQKTILKCLLELSDEVTAVIVAQEGDEIVVTARGISSHAAHPEGSVNAIGRLASFLAGAQCLNDGDRNIFEFVADTLSDHTGERLGIAHSDEPSGALTCICGLAKTEGGKLSLNFNIRYPVTDKGERCVDIMKTYFAASAWTVTGFHDSMPAYLPKDDPKVQALCNIYADVTGKDSTPYVMGGGTYARKLKNAIGFGMENPGEPTPFAPGHGGVHQPDEAIRIQDLLDAIKIYVISMLEIDKLLHN